VILLPKPIPSTVSGVVAEVDNEECALEFCQLVSFREDLPTLVSGSGLLQIINVADDKVWVHGVEPGHEVWQKLLCYYGRLEDLFQAFESQWSKLWSKHSDVPASQWEDIVDFAQLHLRPVAPPAPELSVRSLQRCARRKSWHSAVSLDGVSWVDVLSLHDSELACILKLYSQAGQPGTWPEQVLQGHVRSLAKSGSPEGVNHYRPITVLSFLYRTWTTLAAKHWLHEVSKIVDPFLFGSTTGKLPTVAVSLLVGLPLTLSRPSP
jgi:hypothetical protein